MCRNDDCNKLWTFDVMMMWNGEVVEPTTRFLDIETDMGLSGSKKKKKKKVEVNKYERTIRMAELLMLVNHLGNRFTKDTEAWKYFSSMDEQNRAVRRTQKIHHHIIHTNMYTSGVRLV